MLTNSSSNPVSADNFFLSQLHAHGVKAIEVNFFGDNTTPCLDMHFVDKDAAQKVSLLVKEKTSEMPSSDDGLTLYLTEQAVNDLFSFLQITTFNNTEAYFTSLLNHSRKLQTNQVKSFAMQQLAGFTIQEVLIVLQKNEYRLQLKFSEQKRAKEWQQNIEYYGLDNDMWVSEDGLTLTINKAAADKMFELTQVPSYEQDKTLFDSLLSEQKSSSFYLEQLTQRFNRAMEAKATFAMVLPRGQNRSMAPFLLLTVHECFSTGKQQLLNQWYGYEPGKKIKCALTQKIAQPLFHNIQLEKLGKINQGPTYGVLLREYIHELAKKAKSQGAAREAVAEIVSAIHSLLQENLQADAEKQAKANGLMDILKQLGDGKDMKTAITLAKNAYPELTEKSLLTFWKNSRVAELLDTVEKLPSLTNNPNNLTFNKASLLDKLTAKLNEKLRPSTASLRLELDEDKRHYTPALIISLSNNSEQAGLFLKQLSKDFDYSKHTGMSLGPANVQRLCIALGMEKHGYFNPQDTYEVLVKEWVSQLAKQAKHQGHDKHDLAEITTAIDKLTQQKQASNQGDLQLQINALCFLLMRLSDTIDKQQAVTEVRESYVELAGKLKNCLADKVLAILNAVTTAPEFKSY